MFCTHCATFNPSDTACCRRCGARLERPSVAHTHRRRTDTRGWFLLLPFALALGAMAIVGWRTWETRQSQSAAYDRALAALETGDLPAAIAQFGEAGGYRDAPEQRITAQQLLAPYQAAYLDARAALDQGEHQRAVQLLRSVVAAMPDNIDAAALLVTAERRFGADLQRAITVATTNRSWLDVERAMLELATFTGEPADPGALSEFRLAHAPVLFTRNGALYRIGPDGGDEELVFDGLRVALPLWSPDRSRIAFFSALPESETFAALFTIDADGTNLQLVDETAIASLPAWSPDGARLAFVTAADETGRTTTLRIFDVSAAFKRDMPIPVGALGMTSPSWSGDGARLAAIELHPNGENVLVGVDAESLEASPLLESTPPNVRAVSWSPGADALVLWGNTGDSDWYALRGSVVYLVDLAIGSVTPITTQTQAPSRPVWSPDGVHFAYLERGNTLHIRARTGIGERAIELPSKGYGRISWAPGGEGIMIPALDLVEPSMIVPVGERVGPVRLLTLNSEGGWVATDVLWAPYTVPDPALYNPVPVATVS